MGKLCCSNKEGDMSRGPGKMKEGEDDEIDSIASHQMNINDSLHLEYAQKLQKKRNQSKLKMVRSASTMQDG